MLNVGKIEEGFVLDHIKAGKSLSIYEHLQLDKLDCTVAIIKNARSGKMGKKDILKVECDIDMLHLGLRHLMTFLICLGSTSTFFSTMRKKRSTAANTAKRNTAKAKNLIQQMPYQQPLVGHIYNTYSASSSVFFSLSSCFCIYIISNLT